MTLVLRRGGGSVTDRDGSLSPSKSVTLSSLTHDLTLHVGILFSATTVLRSGDPKNTQKGSVQVGSH